MAYVNVKDWSVEQVTEWLKGLDNVILPYTSSFLNNEVTGHQLLNLRADDLENLGVKILGHQEIMLEAVEHLRHIHYELDKENLQMLALKLSCAANSLFKELLLEDDDATAVQTQTLADVHTIITTIKPLVFWLDRPPFAGDKDYIDNKTQLLQYALEMATSAHRDTFSENPVLTIRQICDKLVKIADHIIQDISDPMILQPASLDLATLKKKEQELGFFILPSNHATHQIADIKFGSPAHGNSKIEEGDEIVQVNYQTVVGWQRKKVMLLLQESPPEIVLTLKKRPRHTKVYGQIYMKPYRLPSKKRQPYSRWNDSLPSPRLMPIQDLPPIPIPKITQIPKPVDVETEISSSDSEPPDSPLDSGPRVYPLKPRPILQRRNTISGATPTHKRPHPSIEQCLQLFKHHAASVHASSNQINDSKFEDESKFIRDKSASCNLGLELSPRPSTVIGLTQNLKKSVDKTDLEIKKRVNFEEVVPETKEQKTEYLQIGGELDESKSLSVNSLASISNEKIDFIDEGRELTDRSSMTSGWQKEIVEELIDTIKRPKNVDVPVVLPRTVYSSDVSTTSVTNVASHSNCINKADTSMVSKNTSIENQSSKNDSSSETVKNSNIDNDTIKSNGVRHTTNDAQDGCFSHSTDETPSVREDSKSLKDSVLLEVNIHNIIKKFDEQQNTNKLTSFRPKAVPRVSVGKKPPEVPAKPLDPTRKPVVPPRHITTVITTKPRGRLDKSHSTPAYDLTEDDNSVEGTQPEKREVLNKPKTDKIPEYLESNESSPKANLAMLEIGIPVKEESNYIEIASTSTMWNIPDDLPPKPPPRTFGLPETNKPAYPADSPKPSNLVELIKSNQNTPKPSPKVFEFPETTKSVQTPKLPPTPYAHDASSKIPNYQTVYGEEKPIKCFEPAVASTPLVKHPPKVETAEFEPPVYKNSSSFEIQPKSVETKTSPTNSIVRAMISSNKNKSAKKRNHLAAKRRKVSVNDLNPPDMQGYLYQRLRVKQTQNVSWEKRWFVLFANNLYGYKTKEDSRAACLIFLSGFTVALATEVKSRTNAFKVYHTGTVFYFSTEDPGTLQCWIDKIMVATLPLDTAKSSNTLYSETDDSDNEKYKSSQSDRFSEPIRKFGSLKKFTTKKHVDTTHSGSTSLDRKWFFNKSSGHSKNTIPVPTAQFRSYRRIQSNNVHASVTTGNFTSHVPLFGPRLETQQKNVSVPNLTVDHTPKTPEQPTTTGTKSNKNKAHNYIHASNPSLCNTTDFNLGKKTFKNENLVGFVTLEELMIKQSEERKSNPHNVLEENQFINLNLIKPDVVYGEVPIRPREKLEAEPRAHNPKKLPQNTPKEVTPKHESSSSCFGKRLGSITRSHKDLDFQEKTSTFPKTSKGFEKKSIRSLPRTHKLQEKYSHTDDYGTNYLSDRTIDDNLDGPYEMIYGIDDSPPTRADSKKGHKIRKQHSFTSSDKKYKSDQPSPTAIRFNAPDTSSSKLVLKPTVQYTPMHLPISQDSKSKPKFAFELNLDEKSAKSGKLNKIFGKQEGKKEKTFLGSPKLHRAIFRKQNDKATDKVWPNTPEPLYFADSDNATQLVGIDSNADTIGVNMSPHADYPGLEYPPVFEPETYSLADPQTSLTILRKQGKDA